MFLGGLLPQYLLLACVSVRVQTWFSPRFAALGKALGSREALVMIVWPHLLILFYLYFGGDTLCP